MKRPAAYILTGAVTGFLGLLGIHAVSAAPEAPAVADGGDPAGSSPSATPSSSASPAETASPGTQAGSGRDHRHAGGTAGTSRGGTAGGSGPVRRAMGTLEAYGYGELSVTVTVKGGEITGVTVPVLEVSDPNSRQVADYAIPQLKSEVLAANSARVHAISGATYTSDAYTASLQSALDKLHLL